MIAKIAAELPSVPTTGTVPKSVMLLKTRIRLNQAPLPAFRRRPWRLSLRFRTRGRPDRVARNNPSATGTRLSIRVDGVPAADSAGRHQSTCQIKPRRRRRLDDDNYAAYDWSDCTVISSLPRRSLRNCAARPASRPSARCY